MHCENVKNRAENSHIGQQQNDDITGE